LFSIIVYHRFICISYYLLHILLTDMQDDKVNTAWKAD
jgi:hypothetical protein